MLLFVGVCECERARDAFENKTKKPPHTSLNRTTETAIANANNNMYLLCFFMVDED